MNLEPSVVIILALFGVSLIVQSEWLFFASVCLLVGFLYLRFEEKRLEAAEEKAEKEMKEKEKAEGKPERKIIVLREPLHEPMHEKLPLEIADEVAEKTVFHGILHGMTTYHDISERYGPEKKGHH